MGEQLFEDIDAENADLRGWYDKWRARIHEWVAERSDDKIADVVIVVPDFFMLLVDLARDNRVPFKVKGRIALALAYVLSPVDLMPEAVLGVAGLADDATVMAVLLYGIRHINDFDPAIIRENWRGSGDAIEVIDDVYERVATNVERIVNSRIWQRIKDTFGNFMDDVADEADDTDDAKQSESGRRLLPRLSGLNWRRAPEGE